MTKREGGRGEGQRAKAQALAGALTRAARPTTIDAALAKVRDEFLILNGHGTKARFRSRRKEARTGFGTSPRDAIAAARRTLTGAIPSVDFSAVGSRIATALRWVRPPKGWQRATLLGGVATLGLGGAVHAMAPQITGYLVSSAASFFVDQETVAAVGEKFDCAQATRIALPDALPVYLQPCDEAPAVLGAPFSGQSRELVANAIAVLEGAYRPNARASVAGFNLVGLHRPFKSGMEAGGTGPFGSVYEEFVGETSPGVVDKAAFAAQAASLYGQMSAEQIDGFASMGRACLGLGIPMARAGAAEVCTIMISGAADGEISPGTACLLAAGYRRPIWITSASAGEDRIEAAEERFVQRREVAMVCLAGLAERGVITAELQATEEHALKALPLPTMEALGRPADPLDWLGSALPGAQHVMRDALSLDRNGGRRVTATISAAAQRSLATVMTEELANIAPQLSGGLCLSGCGSEIDHLVAIARRNTDGSLRLVAVSSSDPGMLWGRVSDGILQPMTRSPGSLTKIGAAGCVFALAPPTAEQTFCRNKRFGVDDPGHRKPTNCSSPADYSSLFTIMGRSENSSYAEWARRADPAALRACVSQLGADFHGELTPDQQAKNLALGTLVVFSPAELMQAVSAQAFGSSSLPVAYHEQVGGKSIDQRTALQPALRTLLDATLRAPIDHHFGTLRNFKIPGCEINAAKSGTSDSAAGRTAVRDKLVLVAATCGTQQFVAIAMIGAPDQQHDLGYLPTSAVRHIFERALPNITAIPENRND